MAVAPGVLAEHRQYLLRFARARVRDAALIEDLVQDTLLAAVQGLDGFAHRATLRTWLTEILRHKIADRLRREKRSHEDAGADPAAAVEALDERDPERLLAGRQMLRSLARSLARLPQPMRRAFVLREVDGLSNEAAARELGVTPAHGAVLLHRARAQLRRELAVHHDA